LDYSLYVREIGSQEVQKLEFDLMRELKLRVDFACSELGRWMLGNSHLRLHRLPLLVRKILHFDKVGLSLKIGDAALFHQEQMAHLENFIV
jgi:hypothetical protein